MEPRLKKLFGKSFFKIFKSFAENKSVCFAQSSFVCFSYEERHVFLHTFFEKGKFPEKLSRGRKPFCAKFFGTPFSERRRDFTFLLKREDFLKSFQGAESFFAKFFGTPFSERRRDFTFLLKREEFLKSFQGVVNFFVQSSLAHLSSKERCVKCRRFLLFWGRVRRRVCWKLPLYT